MFHHGPESYSVATSHAAKVAREKLETIIDNGRQNALTVIDKIEKSVITDRIARTGALSFYMTPEHQLKLEIGEDGPITNVHKHALRQVTEIADIPMKYVENLMTKTDPWAQELLAYNLNELLRNSDASKRSLVRSLGDETRGILSDRFRRIDSRPLIEAFCKACNERDLLPLEGFALDTKVRMRAVLPMIFEPVNNEVMVFGIQWGNSDYGDGGNCLSTWVMRMWCTNLAMGEELLRQVHLGKRLDDNITYSERTYQLDTQANASAVKDLIGEALSPWTVNSYLDCVKKATDQDMSIDTARNLFKKVLHKEEARLAEDAFKSPDVQNLPPGDNLYRLSNAISWIAQGKEVPTERKLELQKIAGEVLPKPKNRTKLVEV